MRAVHCELHVLLRSVMEKSSWRRPWMCCGLGLDIKLEHAAILQNKAVIINVLLIYIDIQLQTNDLRAAALKNVKNAVRGQRQLGCAVPHHLPVCTVGNNDSCKSSFLSQAVP
jgi:hypothetical protein